MRRFRVFIYSGAFLPFIVTLAACSSLYGPRQIAAYPRNTPTPDSSRVRVYDSYLELLVPDVGSAADQAIRLTNDAGGILVELYNSPMEQRDRLTLILAVPANRAAALLSVLLELGTPIDDRVTARVPSISFDGSATYACIKLSLLETYTLQPAVLTSDWYPLHTIDTAWKLSFSILSFLVDALIWLTIVSGPFILFILLVRYIVRRCNPGNVSRM